MYLIDLQALKTGRPLTDFFYIRQKEGPYCVELGSRWFKPHEGHLDVVFRDRKPVMCGEAAAFSTTVPTWTGIALK